MHFQNKTNKNKLHEAGPKKKKIWLLMLQCNSSFGDKHLHYDTGTWELY